MTRVLSAHLRWLALALLSLLLLACAPGSSSKPASEAVSAAPAPQGQQADKEAGPDGVKGDPQAKGEVVILAGGCFWGMEELLRQVPGVLHTEVGYTGGNVSSPSYEDVKTGRSGHAESVKVIYDPATLPFDELLTKWFFRMHDPTTKDRQGNDVGTQYRSAIFVTSPAQRKVAEAVKVRVDKSGQWGAPIVTEIVDAGPFTPAESYHQDYLQKNPGGYTCHYLREDIAL